MESIRSTCYGFNFKLKKFREAKKLQENNFLCEEKWNFQKAIILRYITC